MRDHEYEKAIEEGGSTGRLKVQDEENQSQAATITRIQKYRDRLAEYASLFASPGSDITYEQVMHAYHQDVYGFVQLLKPYLKDADIGHSTDYWERKKVGEITFTPPEPVRKQDRRRMEAELKRGNAGRVSHLNPRNTVEAETYTIQGLREFADLDPSQRTLERSWEIMVGPETPRRVLKRRLDATNAHVEDPGIPGTPLTVTVQQQIPRQLVDEARTLCEEFVRESGMDVEFDPEPYYGEGEPGI